MTPKTLRGQVEEWANGEGLHIGGMWFKQADVFREALLLPDAPDSAMVKELRELVPQIGFPYRIALAGVLDRYAPIEGQKS